MAPDILARIGGDRADLLELEQVLLGRFGRCMEVSYHAYAFGDPASPAMTLHFAGDKKTKHPSTIEPGPEWSADHETALTETVAKELLAEGPIRVGREVLFNYAQVVGQFATGRVPDPASPSRRQWPGIGWSGHQPYLLEVAFPSSSNPLICQIRRYKREREIELQLTALLFPSPTSQSRTLVHHWVSEPMTADRRVVSRAATGRLFLGRHESNGR